MDRREFLGSAAATAASFAVRRLCGGEPEKPYVRANTDWLARCRFGIGVHWTAQTVPRMGKPLPFPKAVADFDLKGFIAAVEHAGADYVLFTSAHALQMLPAPHPVLDKILPGRTCERDLIAELADALAAKQKHLLVYYNHSCNGKQDAAWEQAVGYHAPNKERFAQNLVEIVSWMGDRYRDKIKAWWFDSPYSLDTRGPHNSVTTDMSGFQFPWERFTAAAKTRRSRPAGDLQRRCQRDLPLHDAPGLLGRGIGRSEASAHSPISFCQWPPVVRLDVPGRPGMGASPVGHGNSAAALFERRDWLLCAHLQQPPSPDDLQRWHLPGRNDGRSVRRATAPAESGFAFVTVPQAAPQYTWRDFTILTAGN